ncbi:MAG TPA: DUF2497 domain-containing protein [Rhizorhapis sp.]
MAKEPSMEDILSSIKRIIAEESETAATAAVSGIARKSRAKPALSDDIIGGNASTEPLDNDEPDEVLELTDLELTDTVMPEVQNAVPGTSDEEPEGQAAAASATLLSHETAAASRHSLAALSALIIRADDAPSNTLEGLIRDMLRPMLREWLDANLPELVQKMVAKEIARLTEGQF